MDSANKIIKSLWIGDKLSKLELLSINSFLFNGHEFHLYTYNDIKNLPKDITVKNANEILPESKLFSKKFNDKSPKGIHVLSDIFRHKLLYELGGWWSDLDVVCLQPFNFGEEYVFASLKEDANQAQIVNSFVLKMPAGCAELKYCLDEYNRYNDGDDIAYGQLGPKLIRQVVEKYDKNAFVKNWEIFCPINWRETEKFILPNYSFQITPDMFALHLFNVKWEEKKINKDDKFDDYSIYEQLKKFYGVL